jgi:hypothetical protein
MKKTLPTQIARHLVSSDTHHKKAIELLTQRILKCKHIHVVQSDHHERGWRETRVCLDCGYAEYSGGYSWESRLFRLPHLSAYQNLAVMPDGVLRQEYITWFNALGDYEHDNPHESGLMGGPRI